jgi:hypothetical protein
MPMGITADIYDDKDVELPDYLRGVARSMTTFIHMRDEPINAELTKRDLRGTYHDEKIAAAKETLAELAMMGDAEAARRAKADHAEELAAWNKRKDESDRLRERYGAMKEQVEAWDCPEIIAYVKEHAIKYLDESIDFDCHDYDNQDGYFAAPKELTANEWMDDQIAKAKRSLDYNTAELANTEKRDAEFSEHIDAFLDSLAGLEEQDNK